MKHTSLRISSSFCASLMAFATVSMSLAEQKAPERLDLAAFPGEIVNHVVVPIPAEIFAVLDKLDEPDWNSGIILTEREIRASERALLALTFGSMVGEGFIAVQAKNADAIQKIGLRVLSLSESLGLAEAVKPHSLSIVEAAEKRDWQRVRDELDRTQQTVKNTMERLRDDELSGLVSLGGWLRGTHVVTTFISLSYSDDKAELLNQPSLIQHFRELLESINAASSSSAQLRSIAVGFSRMEAIVGEEGNLSQSEVTELRDISRSMLDEYYFSRE